MKPSVLRELGEISVPEQMGQLSRDLLNIHGSLWDRVGSRKDDEVGRS